MAKRLDLRHYSGLRKRELQLAIIARKNAEMGFDSGFYRPRKRTHKKDKAYYFEDRLGNLVSMPLPEKVAKVKWIRKVKELDKSEVEQSRRLMAVGEKKHL
jgi:hypothetical protein